MTGPTIFKPGVRNKLPEDAVVNCEDFSFPICRPQDLDKDGIADSSTVNEKLTPFASGILERLPAELREANNNQLCNGWGCLNRADLKLAGVLHGSTTCKCALTFCVCRKFWLWFWLDSRYYRFGLRLVFDCGPGRGLLAEQLDQLANRAARLEGMPQ